MSLVNFSIIFHTYVSPYVLKFETNLVKLLFDRLNFVDNVIEILIEYILLYEYLFETL